MQKRIVKGIRIFDILLSLLCIVTFIFVAIGEYTMPKNVVNYSEKDERLSSIFTYSNNSKVQTVNSLTSYPRQETLKLLGVVPVKNITVTNKKAKNVYVSGEPFGIKLYTDGVIVVGTQAVDVDSKKINPAQEAGIEVGDIIVSINNVNVYSSNEVTDILNDNNGLDYKIKIKRDERFKTFTLTPVYSNKEGCYKAGMWVRDSTAGIGTITFYNSSNGSFAGLGHQINDIDTKELMPMLQGEAVCANVSSVQKANSGTTGSLICDFSNSKIGELVENVPCGVFGKYDKIGSTFSEYPISSAQEVKKGTATMISTIDGNVPKAYEIEIMHINYNSGGEKDITFKITDDDLISKTGGIVQGMSGSPIIQDGKLIGAVTHVIINNPKKGYAIFAQTMYEESLAVK